MSSKKIYTFVLLGSSLICFLVFFLLTNKQEKKNVSQVSFFSRESAEEYNRTSLKQGIEQGAKDFGAVLTVQFLNNTGSASDMVDLLEKEIENKTDAILVEPVDEEAVLEKLKKCGKEIPVVLVNAGFTDSDDFAKITCDNKKLGKDMASEIMKENQENRKVLLVTEPLVFQDDKEACEGIEEGLGGACEIEHLVLSGDEEQRQNQITERLKKGDIHAAVALSAGSRNLELLGRLKRRDQIPREVLVYGIGKNNQIIADMEDGYIQAVGVINSYSVGYLSVQQAIQGRGQEKEVMASIINKDEIYTPENQRMLFTLVQ